MDKERNALDTLMEQIELCLAQMPETEDWYFTAGAREEVDQRVEEAQRARIAKALRLCVQLRYGGLFHGAGRVVLLPPQDHFVRSQGGSRLLLLHIC